jgi:CheY-like chemotaxis protein
MDLSEKQRDAIRMIITSGELLCAVVNDILDFSKLESGNVVIEIRPTSLQETLDSVVNSIEHKAKAKQLKFRTNYSPALPHCIETDGNRLQQILYNLLGNATKFSETGGSIELSVDYEDTPVDHIATPAEQGQVEPTAVVGTTSNQSNGVLRFSVKDYGTGIDSKDFLRIFEPFRQANGDTERLYGGTGLGLAITSRLVERLGGEISVDSEVGRWSKFTVSLPVTTISLFERTSAVRQLADAHILYVDEPNEPNCRVLGSLGVSMDRFSTSQELLDWFLSHKRSRDHHFYFCLVHEDLFSPDIHRKISEVAPNALVTFGPQLSQFAESHAHYRTLSGRIPSVLLKSLADLRDDVVDPTSRARNTVKLQPLDIVKRIDVLIAEDNVINQKVLCKMLNRVGVEHIDIANNGREAVEMATQKNYDIIFMDMQMPIMCGDEACRIILDRCKARDRRPKIAFVSAHASTNFELQAAAAGADGFMSKPFNVKKFEDFVRTLNIHTSAPLST